MLTSLFYQVFQTSGQECIKTEYKNGAITYYIQTKDDRLQCAYCNSFNISKKGNFSRFFKVDLMESKPIFIKAVIQRLVCRDCGLIRQEKVCYGDEMYLYELLPELYNSNNTGLFHL
jgi:hypothetical protein